MSREGNAAPAMLDDRAVLNEDDARDLKHRTIRGLFASGTSQGVGFVLRTGSMVAMARLLVPAEFGLFSMVTAFTSFLNLFRDFGLSLASVTRASVTEEQISTLFWVNVAAGVGLAMLCSAAAPLLVSFYREPRLFAITLAVAVGFIFTGAGVQHRAILQRSLRFSALAVVDTVSVAVGILIGIAMAVLGYGYWSLVAMTLAPQICGTVGVWIATRWAPGRPTRRAGVRSMIRYGGGATINGFIVYLAYNADKVLLGRYWGAEVLGIYGRAYSLVSLPTENLYSSISSVAFPALARLQNDSARLRSFFLQGYKVFLAIVLPLIVGSALFGEDIIRVFLGQKWLAATPVFRLLTPTMLAFALVNPFGWILMATGRIARSVKMALLIAPTVIIGCVIGLRFGAVGVATGFSSAMILLAWPLVVWARRGTSITSWDIAKAIFPPAISLLSGAVVAYVASPYTGLIGNAFLRLCAETACLFGIYWLALSFGFNQKLSYTLLSGLKGNTTAASAALAKTEAL